MSLLACVLLAVVGVTSAGNASGDISFLNSSADIGAIEANSEWSKWLDGNSNLGTGDYENINAWIDVYNNNTATYCDMPCQSPSRMQWRLAKEYQADEEAINKCLVLDTNKMAFGTGVYPGFNCLNYRQTTSPCTVQECIDAGMRFDSSKRSYTCDKCPNFEIRVMCPKATKRSLDTRVIDCDYTNKREMRLQQMNNRMVELEAEEIREKAMEQEYARMLIEQQVRANEQQVPANEQQETEARESRLINLLNQLVKEHQ